MACLECAEEDLGQQLVSSVPPDPSGEEHIDGRSVTTIDRTECLSVGARRDQKIEVRRCVHNLSMSNPARALCGWCSVGEVDEPRVVTLEQRHNITRRAVTVLSHHDVGLARTG